MRRLSEDGSEPCLALADAKKELRRVGTAHARGDALRAMYTRTLALTQGGTEAVYYHWFQAQPARSDQDISATATVLLRDRVLAWDALMGNDISEQVNKEIEARKNLRSDR